MMLYIRNLGAILINGVEQRGLDCIKALAEGEPPLDLQARPMFGDFPFEVITRNGR